MCQNTLNKERLLCKISLNVVKSCLTMYWISSKVISNDTIAENGRMSYFLNHKFKKIKWNWMWHPLCNKWTRYISMCRWKVHNCKKRKICTNICFYFGTVMCAAHADVAPAQKANNPPVQWIRFFNQFFFFLRICTARDSTGSCLFSFKIELLWKKKISHNVMG